jgi:hypothetical protein
MTATRNLSSLNQVLFRAAYINEKWRKYNLQWTHRREILQSD